MQVGSQHIYSFLLQKNTISSVVLPKFIQSGKLKVVKQRSLFRFVVFLHTAESHL